MKKIMLLAIGILLISLAYAQNIWSDTITRDFEITEAYPICDKETYTWKQWDSASGEIKETDAMTSCYWETGFPKICCPSGYTCQQNPDEDNHLHCVTSTIKINYCQDYQSGPECESDTQQVAAKSIKYINPPNTPANICEPGYLETKDGGYFRNAECLCYWDEDEETCHAGIEYSVWWYTTPGIDTPEIVHGEDGVCIIKKGTTTGDCAEDDFIRIEYAREWIGGGAPDGCSESFTRTIACPTRLNFFTITTLILTIVIIIAVYAFLQKKRK